MSFLKTLGSDLKKVFSVVVKGTAEVAKVSQVVATIDPELAPVADGLTALAGVVAGVETIGQSIATQAAGETKLQAAIPLAEAVLKSSGLMDGKVVADATKYATALKGFVSNFADLLNSLETAATPAAK